MDTQYTNERNHLILMSLMKEHGIRKVIASPGTTNIRLVASMQQDPYFEMYSAADERSAAYMACGLAAESGEAVAISCTGATASRNYVPGLTEAYYRHLPILAITSTHHMGEVGNLVPQVIDRSQQMKDMVNCSVSVPMINPEIPEDEWSCAVAINKALIALHQNGGGPAHINLATSYSRDFSVKQLPSCKVIKYYFVGDELPKLQSDKIAILVGSRLVWSEELISNVESFCEKYNAVVLGDHTSGYKGKYFVQPNLLTAQKTYNAGFLNIDLLIHIGEMSGAYAGLKARRAWRVNADGQVKDPYRILVNVFHMKEEQFFKIYAEKKSGKEVSYATLWRTERQAVYDKIPEDLPFSNPWLAKTTAPYIPEGAVMHFGILSSLRSWNFFETHPSVHGYSNVGGFGIDGGVSSLMGASLANRNKLYFGIFGDLAFFYDMNVVGNRHVGNNVRIMLVNNGKGTEFRNYSHYGAQFGEDADEYIAAARHYGNKSPNLIRHYAEDLGYDYLTASNKEEYMQVVDRFTTPEITDRPMLLEVFTDSKDEGDALYVIDHLQSSTSGEAKQLVKNVLGEKGVSSLKKIKGKLGL